MKINQIIIGVTQFGMQYGIFNKSHTNKRKKLKQILVFSAKKKIKSLYTSKYYGNANYLLKSENLRNFHIYLKYKPKDLLNSKFIYDLNKTKKYFKKNQLFLMIDNFEKLDGKEASMIYRILINLKKKKVIKKFGYSIYSFRNLKEICKSFKPDIVQCSYNVMDRRLDENIKQQYFKKNKIEIHVRSIFLQGLLLVDPLKLPKKFLKWKKNFETFSDLMKYQNISKLSGCFNFVQRNKNINKILVGVDNLEQLLEIYNIKINKKIKYPKNYIKSEKLINPSLW